MTDQRASWSGAKKQSISGSVDPKLLASQPPRRLHSGSGFLHRNLGLSQLSWDDGANVYLPTCRLLDLRSDPYQLSGQHRSFHSLRLYHGRHANTFLVLIASFVPWLSPPRLTLCPRWILLHIRPPHTIPSAPNSASFELFLAPAGLDLWRALSFSLAVVVVITDGRRFRYRLRSTAVVACSDGLGRAIVLLSFARCCSSAPLLPRSASTSINVFHRLSVNDTLYVIDSLRRHLPCNYPSCLVSASCVPSRLVVFAYIIISLVCALRPCLDLDAFFRRGRRLRFALACIRSLLPVFLQSLRHISPLASGDLCRPPSLT
ncbi:hypothetical protein C8R45DRAFT_1114347 [Mycena sanguinolenta]|nr:hypothetical protein C8R45DRAFT_1114347 [Mycena sanguinolenta]